MLQPLGTSYHIHSMLEYAKGSTDAEWGVPTLTTGATFDYELAGTVGALDSLHTSDCYATANPRSDRSCGLW